MAGGRTRWAVILSGLWMLVFVVALGPLLSEVPIPALAGLLILAGFGSLKPRDLARTWQTSKSSGAAALITMVATLLVPIHVAVLIGVILSLLLVGINSSHRATAVVALEPVAPGSLAPCRGARFTATRPGHRPGHRGIRGLRLRPRDLSLELPQPSEPAGRTRRPSAVRSCSACGVTCART